MEETNKSIVIFWGSQSGTGQGFASRLERELLARFGVESMAADLSDYDAATISLIPSSKFAIFIMATFGDGDPSDNAAGFMEHLQRVKDNVATLKNLRHCVLGLGDSNYQHFNRVAVSTAAAFERLGAAAFLPLSKADAANGTTEEDFMEWKEALLGKLQSMLGLEEQAPVYVPQLKVVEDKSIDSIDLFQGTPVYPHSVSQRHFSPIEELPVASWQELFCQQQEESDGNVRHCIHIDLDISDMPQLRYKTGDYLAVWPSNNAAEVRLLLAVLGLEFNGRHKVPVLVKKLDAATNVPVPSPTTMEALFTNYLEIGSSVSRDVILMLLPYAPSTAAREFLQELAKNKHSYTEFMSHNHITLARLLKHAAQQGGTPDADGQAPWSSLPISLVIESLPPLHPRLYSISSSSTISPRHPSLTALVVRTPLARNSSVSVPGLTSNYLYEQCMHSSSCGGRTKLHAAIRKSAFVPPVFSTPLIMIAAGTGLAPFRAFVMERARIIGMGKPVGMTLLFFGCRSPKDYIYRQELEAAIGALPQGQVVPVYSRHNDGAGEKTLQGDNYVQHAIRRHPHLAELIIDRGARVFVCGRAVMGREVCAALREIVQAYKPANLESEAACNEWWDGWRRGGGYTEDVWG
ncbi:hypothetical protein SEUCBS139899_003750 [Sporothrix eucalyptigena]